MGHYYSEMHVPTPDEDFANLVKNAREKLGFRSLDVNYTHLFLYSYCSCVIEDIVTHFMRCNMVPMEVRDPFRKELSWARFIVRNVLESGACARMKLIEACSKFSVSALALRNILDELARAKEITYTKDLNDEFKDKIYSLVVAEETVS